VSEGVPRASIVVAVYNGAASIEACIQSLLALDYPHDEMEILVVDNGSTDATVELLQPYEGRIRILHQSTRGAAAARNAGIREARGSFVAFTDADCTVEPQWLRALSTPLADPTVGIVGGKICARAGANRIERFGERIHDHQAAIEDSQPPYAISMNWASPTSRLEEVGLFDESLLRGQDVDLAYRFHAAGWRLVYASDAVIHHLNEQSFTGLFHEGMVHGRHSLRLMRKHRLMLMDPPMRIWLPLFLRLLSNSLRCIVGEARFEAFCAVVFDLGKLLGQAYGLVESAAAPDGLR